MIRIKYDSDFSCLLRLSKLYIQTPSRLCRALYKQRRAEILPIFSKSDSSSSVYRGGGGEADGGVLLEKLVLTYPHKLLFI